MINNFITQYHYGTHSDDIEDFKSYLTHFQEENSIFPDPSSFINDRIPGQPVSFKNIQLNSTNYNVYDIFNK